MGHRYLTWLLIAALIAGSTMLIDRALDISETQRLRAQAEVYCARAIQPHYCFEVAMQEGIDAVSETP